MIRAKLPPETSTDTSPRPLALRPSIALPHCPTNRSTLRILVTGGAGYIGSHTVRALVDAGHDVVVVDDLSLGHRAAVDVDFVRASVGDRATMSRIMRARGTEAVIHLAAFAAAGESVADPGKYFANNVCGTRSLLDAMVDASIRLLVFSSSCSIYGQPDRLPVDEDSPKRPESPYGQSKLMCEQMLGWYERAHGLRSVSLRYFNAAGASLDGSLGDDVRPATRLLPVALEVALGRRPALKLCGTNYPTPDGTCIRDYVHVVDIAEVHRRALEYLLSGGMPNFFNVGRGHGYSNREVIDEVGRVVGGPLPLVEEPRRPGDPAEIYADTRKIHRILGWEPIHSDLRTIVESAWRWRSANPDGYRA